MFRWLLILLVLALALLGWGYANITADPVVREARIGVLGLTQQLRVALIGDIHVQGPDMPPDRVRRLVERVNAQRPDLILLAGDFIGDRQLSTREYADAEIAHALQGLRAPMGVFGVLGNHDHWRDGPSLAKAMEAVGIQMLDNRARTIGPITLIGVGDIHTRHADMKAAQAAIATLPGPYLAFTHSPDAAPELPPRIRLLLAGHTHCAQIVLPLIGPVASASSYGHRYRCGLIEEDGRAILVTSGWGASVLPLRYGAPPDWWLVTLIPR